MLASLMSLTMVALAAPPANSAAWSFPDSRSVPDGTTLVAVNEPNVFDAWSDWSAFEGANDTYTTKLCPSGAVGPNCDPEKAVVFARSIVSICQTPQDRACVESLRASASGSDWVNAEFSRAVTGQNYEAENQGAVPAGEISLWNIPGLTHSGGRNSYAVVVKLRQVFNRATQRFDGVGLSANVSPYSETAGRMPRIFEDQLNGQTRVFVDHNAACIWADSQGCGIVEDFPPNVRVELKLRAPDTITGWFRGRLQDPQIKIERYNQGVNHITVGGLVASVPRFSVLANRAETPESVSKTIAATGGKNPGREIFTGQSIRDFFSNEGERLFEVIDGLRKTAKDTAQGTSSLWNFTTIDSNMNQRCFTSNSEVLGIVTTNATAYLGDPPEFSSGYLNYKVAGMHYAPDGKTLNLGTYDLIMSSSVARCLYGFSNAPIQASIQVINEGGEATVATTQVSERDGWLKLSAYGFTFSEKNIQVKLSQFTPRNFNLTKFSGKSTRLSSAQSKALRDALADSQGASSATCTGFFTKQSERALALSRAKEACKVMSIAKPDWGIASGAKLTKSAASNSRVSIGIK